MKPILKVALAGAAGLFVSAGVASAQTDTLTTVKNRGMSRYSQMVERRLAAGDRR